MKLKLRMATGLLCLLLILGLATAVNAEGGLKLGDLEQFIDPEMPVSWYEAPKLASEIGITEFNQSPMLDERVASGELPPVEDRLPKDPPVQEPYQEIGKYGGTFDVFSDSFDFAQSILGHTPTSNAGTRFRPDEKGVFPWMVENYEYNNNNQEITISLREGLKWSDGEPLTASDYLFWFEKEIQNETITPVSFERVPLLDVTSKDPYTVTLHYEKPYYSFGEFMFARGMTGSSRLTPEHFMKQFHKDIVGEEKVKEKMEVTGHDDWREYWLYKKDASRFHPEHEGQSPTLLPYVAVKRTTSSIIFERNPYYPFVDPEGNQLPYIDRVRLNIVSSREMITAKAVTGEADWDWNHLQSKDLPVLVKNEDKGGYKTLIYTEPTASKINIMVNLNHPDSQMRAIFQDVRFRRALSLAINREEIKDKYYLGYGESRQHTVPTSSEYYKSEYARAYADYNPEKAKELLDEMGMVDRNGDGFREMPEGVMKTMKGEEVKMEGGSFEPIFLVSPPEYMTPTEIMQKHFHDIGINLRVDQLGSSLYAERRNAGKFDIHSHHYYANPANPYYPNTTCSPYPLWTRWYHTDGEAGEEPPEEIKKLIKVGDIAKSGSGEEQDEAIKTLLETQAEKLWTIGVIGMTPRPVVVTNHVRNVSEKNLHDFILGAGGVARPIQFYIEE